MIKRLISLALCVVLTASVMCVAPIASVMAEDVETDEIKTVLDNEDQEVILKYLGIKKENSGALNQEITRGEFADMLVPIISFASEGNNVNPFVDVPDTHQYYSSINKLINCGVMNGVSATVFDPDSVIRYEHARIALLRAMSIGRYQKALTMSQQEYEMLADDIKLPRRVAGATAITRHMSYDLLYDALFSKTFDTEGTGYGVTYRPSDTTFLEDQFDIVFVKGQLTDNGITSLTGKTQVGTKCVMLDDTVLVTNDSQIKNYLGYELNAYVHIDDENTLACYSVSDRNTVININSRDYIGVTGNRVRYADAGKEKSINIAEDINVIYNGKYDITFQKSDFENIDGYVTFIMNYADNSYSTAIVHDKTTFVVSRISADKKIVVDRDENNFVLDGKDADLISYFYKGEEADFESITVDSVLSIEKSRDEKILNVYISDTEIVGIVDSLQDDGLYIEGVFYPYTKHYIDKVASSDYREARAGIQNLIYLDYDGEVAKINERVLRNTYGWLENLYCDISVDTCFAKIYTEYGNMETYKLKNYISLNSGKVKALDTLTNPALYEAGKGIKRQLIMFKVNEKGELYELDTAYDMRDVSGYVGYDENKFTLDAFTSESAFRSGAWSNFDDIPTHLIKKSTIVFIIPSPRGRDEKHFSVKTGSMFLHNTKYQNVFLYNSQEDRVADVAVMYTPEDELVDPVKDTSPICVVERFTEAIDEDGEDTIIVHGYNNDGEISIYAESYDVCDSTGFYWPVADETLDENRYAGYRLGDLKKGSVIQYDTNAYGKVSGIRILHIPGLEPYPSWTCTRGVENNSTIRNTMMYRLNKNFYQFGEVKETYNGVLVCEIVGNICPFSVDANKTAIIVDNNYIELGTVSDIEPGDKVMIASSWQSFATIVCYKQ